MPRAGQYLNSNKNVEVEQYQNLRFLQSPTRLLLTKRTSTFFLPILLHASGKHFYKVLIRLRFLTNKCKYMLIRHGYRAYRVKIWVFYFLCYSGHRVLLNQHRYTQNILDDALAVIKQTHDPRKQANALAGIV